MHYLGAKQSQEMCEPLPHARLSESPHRNPGLPWKREGRHPEGRGKVQTHSHVLIRADLGRFLFSRLLLRRSFFRDSQARWAAVLGPGRRVLG